MSLNTLAHRDTESIDKKCKAIIERGNIIRFLRRVGGTVVKHVSKWEPDDLGDLTADWSNGATLCVCPYAAHYDIEEITPEQAEKERGEQHDDEPKTSDEHGG